MPTEIEVLTTERDNALLEIERLRADGCGPSYELMRAERDAARDAVAAMTVEIADLRAAFVAMRIDRDRLLASETRLAAIIGHERRRNDELRASLNPVVTADVGERSAVTTAGDAP